MPKKHILIDSQSSLLLGLAANFKVLAHWDRKSLNPISYTTNYVLVVDTHF